jgi:hypothetical protein
MSAAEKFRKFASECRVMAEFARSRESKATWDRLAARWVRCAELNEYSATIWVRTASIKMRRGGRAEG